MPIVCDKLFRPAQLGILHMRKTQDAIHPRKRFLWAVLYGILLTACATYMLLESFVIPRVDATVSSLATTQAEGETVASGDSSGTSTSTATSYTDENMSITLTTVREYDTTIYIADVQVSDISYLKTAFAEDSYGRNIKQTTSQIASNHNAILAINGDYYGFRDSGFVLRNGELFRSVAAEDTDALVVSNDGSFFTVAESEVTGEALLSAGAWQVFSFGPTLVEDGEVMVDENTEVDQAKTSNPRTAIGIIDPLHYVIIVSDGRTDESSGLSLYELAQIFREQGCSLAYNLDGGGSSTLWFNGSVVNNPTGVQGSGERGVSDIVYF